MAIVSPYYYRLSPDNVYAYFREIGRNTPVDVTLYNMPMFASPIDVPTIQRLSEECPRIVAIKDSSGDLPQMMRMIAAVRPNRPDFSFLTGWDSVLMPILWWAATAGRTPPAASCPATRLYDATTGGRIRRRACSISCSGCSTSSSWARFFQACRVGIRLRGLAIGPGRQPLSERHQAKLAELEPLLRKLLQEGGIACGQPAGDRLTPQEIGQVVASVLQTLRSRGAV